MIFDTNYSMFSNLSFLQTNNNKNQKKYNKVPFCMYSYNFSVTLMCPIKIIMYLNFVLLPLNVIMYDLQCFYNVPQPH